MTPPPESVPPGGRSPVVLGHRGASADAPENTLAAFELALARGADGIELDVWRCGTGEIVVLHDADTARTCGESVAVRAASLARLRRLDAGSWKGSRFRGERIPTLAEVLDAFPSAIVNVELKSHRLPDLGLAGAVARLLAGAGAVERALVSSFDLALLAAFRRAAPRARAGFLFAADWWWRPRARAGALLRPHALHPEHALVTPGRAARWAAAGLAVHTWTVDDPSEIRRLAALGVASVITNRPEVACAALRGG